MNDRAWVAVGLFGLTVGIFGMIAWKPELTKDAFFTTLAGAVVITGLVNGVVSFWFGASKKDPSPNPQS